MFVMLSSVVLMRLAAYSVLSSARSVSYTHLDVYKRQPVAKAAFWTITDAEARKRGEQTGLDTLVVHAVNDGY